MDQITLWDLTLPTFKTDKPIRLIELFAGYGSQAMAMRNIGAEFTHWKAIRCMNIVQICKDTSQGMTEYVTR